MSVFLHLSYYVAKNMPISLTFLCVFTKFTYIQLMFLAFSVCLSALTFQRSQIGSKTGWNWFYLLMPRLSTFCMFTAFVSVSIHLSVLFTDWCFWCSWPLRILNNMLHVWKVRMHHCWFVWLFGIRMVSFWYILYGLFVLHIIFFVCVLNTFISLSGFALWFNSIFKHMMSKHHHIFFWNLLLLHFSQL